MVGRLSFTVCGRLAPPDFALDGCSDVAHGATHLARARSNDLFNAVGRELVHGPLGRAEEQAYPVSNVFQRIGVLVTHRMSKMATDGFPVESRIDPLLPPR